MPLDGSGDKFYGTYACARARASAPSRTRSFEQELARAREANALSITKCPSLPPSARTRLKSTQSGSFIYGQITINQETRKNTKNTHSLPLSNFAIDATALYAPLTRSRGVLVAGACGHRVVKSAKTAQHESRKTKIPVDAVKPRYRIKRVHNFYDAGTRASEAQQWPTPRGGILCQ